MNIHIPTHTVTHVAAVMTMTMKNMVIPMRMVTHAVADIPMSMHTLIPMLTTFLVTLLTVSAKSAIRMRNTATFAARA